MHVQNWEGKLLSIYQLLNVYLTWIDSFIYCNKLQKESISVLITSADGLWKILSVLLARSLSSKQRVLHE